MDNPAKILEIVRAVSKQNVSPGADDSLFQSGVLDSFALPDLVAELEREFSISIPDSDLIPRKFETLARIESYIQGRI